MEKGHGRIERRWLVALLAVCLGFIVGGAFLYVNYLGDNLREQSLQNVLAVTRQQQQAFDTFIFKDQERLHSYASYFSENGIADSGEVDHLLSLFAGLDASYGVMCLDDGWICGTSPDGSWDLTMTEELYKEYSALEGSGNRVGYNGIHSNVPRFGYYETFTFQNGHRGLIQKSYEQYKIAELFSLSFYDGQGWAYVVDQDGTILVRPSVNIEDQYDNLFDGLSQFVDQEEDINRFQEALKNDKSGSVALTGYRGELIYTYIPMESVDGWFLVSVVPSDAITEETDAILRSSQIAAIFLALILLICVVFFILIWRTQQDMRAKDREIEYQTQLFNILSTHLSRNSDDMFMMMDQATQTIEYVSDNMERVLGVASADVYDYYIDSDKASAPEASLELYAKVAAMSPGEMLTRSAERINPRTGERKYFRETVYCVDLQGKSKRAFYISDRTEEQKDRRNLIDALHMAKAASEAKSSFLSSVSHDIRTPMNAIIGFLALMRDEVDDRAAMLDYIRRIDAASQHLLNLINDVLDMNKIESGSTTLSLAEVNHS